MRKIIVSVSTGFVGSKKTMEIEVEDDATETEIEEEAITAMWEMIDFGWQEKETR